MIVDLPPGFILILGAALLPLFRGRLRSAWILLLPIIGFVQLLGLSHGEYGHIAIFGYTLTLTRIDKLSLVFAYIFHIGALLFLIYSLYFKDNVQHITALIYVGSAISAVCAGDLVVLMIFTEIMAVSSVFLIWARRTERAYAAGMRYLLIQVGSGLLLLAGIVVHVQQTGSIAFNHLGLTDLGAVLIFVALGIKCAFPAMHNWLTDTYPEATVMGTVFLSAFTTKVAVYSLARGYAGTEILIWIGAAMTMFPIFFAVIENDLRRVLAYSLINQVGFMVAGVGIGTEMAVNGAVAHAFADVIFKGLLFMTMGAVLLRTGTIKGSELGGLYKSMPYTATFCIVGAASISAFPLFSAFITKSMVITAAASEGYPLVWFMLLFASAGVFHHAGIKIPYFAFFAHDSGIRCQEAPRSMLIAMGLSAALCIGIGIFPDALYRILPFTVDYAPYTTTHVVTQLQLLLFSALAFAFLIRTGIYPPELRSVNLDVDWVYRRVAPAAVRFIVVQLAHIQSFLKHTGRVIWKTALMGPLAPGSIANPFAGRSTIGTFVLLTTLVLLAYLVLDLF